MTSVCSSNRACAMASMVAGLSVLFATAALAAPAAPTSNVRVTLGIDGVVNTVMSGIARVRISGFTMDQAGKQSLFTQTGTAFLMSRNGYLVTNCHVMKVKQGKVAGPVRMTVEFADDGERLPVTVRGCDETADLAVLHVGHVDSHRTTLRFADTKSIGLGQPVVAIGYAQNLDGQPSVVDGIISGMNRNANGLFSDLIQTNALVKEGNSGGPLLNLRGEVVGVVTYKDGDATGMGYARSANTASVYAQLLMQRGEIRRADFGFTARYLPHMMQERWDLPKFAIMIDKVGVQSPAQSCGLMIGDLIYEIELPGGRILETTNIGNLNDALALVKPGDAVKFNFMRVTLAGWKLAEAANPIPASEMGRFYATCSAGAGQAVTSTPQAGSPG
jgi:serine protease Do